ncbi:hypothetical protein BDW60DRAFT_187696 [Aspergillus nidulans var. acristatus]
MSTPTPDTSRPFTGAFSPSQPTVCARSVRSPRPSGTRMLNCRRSITRTVQLKSFAVGAAFWSLVTFYLSSTTGLATWKISSFQ